MKIVICAGLILALYLINIVFQDNRHRSKLDWVSIVCWAIFLTGMTAFAVLN